MVERREDIARMIQPEKTHLQHQGPWHAGLIKWTYSGDEWLFSQPFREFIFLPITSVKTLEKAK